MDKSRNCMPRGSKTMNSNQLLCGRGVPCKDEGLEKKREIYLNPVLIITSFIHEIYEDMPSMHKILDFGNTFIMSH